MKSKNLLFTIVVSFFITAHQNLNAQAPDWTWARATGINDASYACQPASMAVDATGNVYVVGTYIDTVDFDPGPGVFYLPPTPSWGWAYILKLDNAGNFIWAKSLNGTQDCNAFDIVLDASANIYLAGQFGGTIDFDPDSVSNFNITSAGSLDIFVAKLDSAGNFVWAKGMGGTVNLNDHGNTITLDASGNVYTTGFFTGTGDFDPDTAIVYNLTATSTSQDAFISKLDNSGTFVWAKKIGGNGLDDGNSIAVDAAGNVYSTGSYQNTADFDPGPATYNVTATGNSEDYILKLDSTGNFIWVKTMEGLSLGYGLYIDSNQNILSTGLFSATVDFNPGPATNNLSSAGSWDVFISKLDSAGSFIWAKRVGSTGYDSGRNITMDNSGNIYVTGRFKLTVDFDPGNGTFNLTSASPTGYNSFILKLNSSGAFVWAKAAGGTNREEGTSIVLDNNSNLYATGIFTSLSVVFDSDTITNPVVLSSANTYIAMIGSSIIGTGTADFMNTKGIRVFPNPFDDRISFSTDDIGTSELIIYDISSREILHREFVNSVLLNTEQFAKGLYIYEVRCWDGSSLKGKIVKH